MTDRLPEDPRVDVLDRTTVFQGYLRLERLRLRHRRFDGGWSAAMDREVLVRPHAAAVLPYDPARDAVVLIEQFRPGALAAGVDPWLIEIVAGIIEPGEAPEAVVRREAIEEAGCTLGSLEPIGRVLPSPGADAELIHLYCGRVDSTGVDGLHGVADEHEDIRAFVLPFPAAFARVTEAPVTNGNALIAVQWLALNRDRLRRMWR